MRDKRIIDNSNICYVCPWLTLKYYLPQLTIITRLTTQLQNMFMKTFLVKMTRAELTFVGKGNLDGSVLQGVWMAVSGGGQDWVISCRDDKTALGHRHGHRHRHINTRTQQHDDIWRCLPQRWTLPTEHLPWWFKSYPPNSPDLQDDYFVSQYFTIFN